MVSIRGKPRTAHKPPSRARYEQSHPVVSCRLSKAEYELLKQRLDDLGGVSFADFLKDALGIIKRDMRDVQRIKDTAYREGYDQGKRDRAIWYLCDACGKRVDMIPNGNDHKAMVQYMKQHRWRHAQCP